MTLKIPSRPSGGVVWAAAEGATPALFGTEEPETGAAGTVPLTPGSWLKLNARARVRGVSSGELNAEGRVPEALAGFHDLILGAEQLNRRLLLADQANRQVARSIRRRQDEESARLGLFSVLAERRVALEAGDDLLDAIRIIVKREGIVFRMPSIRRTEGEDTATLQEILDASGIRYRKVRLTPQDRWWRGDSGAMLGFLEADGRPVALLPGSAGRYRMVAPGSGQSVRVTAERAEELVRFAWLFYRPLPDDRPIGIRDLLRFTGRKLSSDLVRAVGAGVIAGAVTLAPAIAVGILIDQVLPTTDGGGLAQMAAVLVVLAVTVTLFQMLQGTALMRLEGRATSEVEAALWNRLLALTPEFFRRFTAGDLAMRVMSIRSLRDQISGAVANAVLSVVFLLPAFILIFLYDTALGWLSLGIGALALVFSVVLGSLQLGPQRRLYAARRRLTGQLFQLIQGIQKLRSSAAEESAFAFWARNYQEQKRAELQIGRLNAPLIAFSAAVPALATAVLFGFAVSQDSDRLAIGDFLAVYAASMIFYGAIVGFGRSFQDAVSIIPGYEQTKPILTAKPEAVPQTGAPVRLNGEIQFDHVSFRYAENGPLILDDVSIHVRPGEFAAIVGESGGGKSTLLRLALGLEEPSVGAVYYDGRDLAHCDRRALRSQLGIVAQNAVLRPGSVLSNIIGYSDKLTIDDAWRAARLAAVDDDIRAMPMEMFTPVGDSHAIFSGGQMQRIQIAAALVHNPRVVFLDEATNWLDSRSQAEVMHGIESLAATRVVVAHRLSTIRKADRIFVLQAGRVVQHGGFDELIKREGLFRELMQRQMT